MAKKSKEQIKVEVRARNRNLKKRNTGMFTEGNEYRFSPGTSGNPSGLPKHHQQLSRVGRTMLSDSAPLAVTTSLGLSLNASWAACIFQRLLFESCSGNLDAVKLITLLTEGNLAARSGFDHFPVEMDGDAVRPLLQIEFINSDGDGRPVKPLAIDAALLSDAVD
jgi:hypothetical protein